MPHTLKVKIRKTWYTVDVNDLDANPVEALVDGELVEVELDSLTTLTQARPEVQAEQQDFSKEETSGSAAIVQHVIRSPMPGVILSVTVKEGDAVKAGDEICILEAMKMQQSLKSDAPGTVIDIRVTPGQQVQGGEAIADLG